MQALVFKSWVGRGSVIEPGAKVVGVIIAPGRFVPAGTVVTSQAAAEKLPEITDDYPFRGLNDAVVHVNTRFATGYRKAAEAEATPDGKGETPAGRVAAGVTEPADAGHH